MEEGRPREQASARARSPPSPVLRLRVRWSRLSLPCGAAEERGRAESSSEFGSQGGCREVGEISTIQSSPPTSWRLVHSWSPYLQPNQARELP